MHPFLSTFASSMLLVLAPVARHGATPIPPVDQPGSGVGPTGPSGPAGPAPSTPRPTAPAPPASPSGTPGGAAVGPKAPNPAGGSGGAGNPSTPKQSSIDHHDWQVWWTFHRDEFLELETALARGNALATGDEAILGGRTNTAALPDPKLLRSKVVPALLLALQGERNPDVLTSCMVALAKLGRGPCVEDAPAIEAAVQPFLADPIQEVSETAALALGLNAAPGSAPALVAIAQDGERGRALLGQIEVPSRTRAFACYGLGLLGARGNADVRRFAAHHLRQTLERDKSGTRDVKVAALVALSLLPVDPAPQPDGTSPAPQALEGDLAWLLAVWNDAKESEHVRVFAATTAGKLCAGSKTAAARAWKSALCDALEPGSPAPGVLRQGAAMALGSCADSDDDAEDARARALLERALREADGVTRRFAAIALARAGARAGSGRGATAGLEPARRALLEGLERGSSALRPWFALALGVCEAARLRAGAEASSEVQAALVRALATHKSPGDAGALCIAAALARAMAARDTITEWVNAGPEAETRPHAAIALGLLGWDGGVLPLRKAVLEARNRPLLLREASIGLGLLGSTDNAASLARMLGERGSIAWLAAVTGALSYVGDARAVEPLLALLEKGERPDRVRAFAASALGGVGDRELLPWNAPIAFLVNYTAAPATLHEPGTGTGILDLF